MKSVLMFVVTVILAISASLFSQTDTGKPGKIFFKGRVLAKPAAGVDDRAFSELISAHNGKTVRKITPINVHIIQVPEGSEEAIVRALSNNPRVEFAELDGSAAPAATTPNDTYFASAWHLAKISAPAAWDFSKADNVMIAILDSGIDTNHVDLKAKILKRRNIVKGTSNVPDVNGHGTLCAGAAAAITNNGAGVAGVGWNASLMVIKVNDDSAGTWWLSDIANGLIWAADNGAKVASISLTNVVKNSTITSAAHYLRTKGGLTVASAENNGTVLSNTDNPDMITVGATDASDVKTAWSNYGRVLDVMAPGNGIYTTQIGGYASGFWGTSASTPIVAGVVALIMAAAPSKTPDQVEQILESTAKDLGAPGFDSLYGWGRVDAAAAVIAALPAPVPPAAPANLSFTDVTSSSITVRWTDNSSNETGFKVYRNTVNSKPASPVYTTSSNAGSQADIGLSVGTTYYYWVEAYNTAGSSSAISGSRATSAAIPSPPTSLVFTGVTSSSITVGWTDNSTGESGFIIYRNTVNSKPATPDYTTAANATSQVDNGLVPATTYYYWVEAYNAAGSSSDISGSQVTGSALPAAPSSLAFSNVTTGAITVGWTDNSDNETGFNIYRNTVNSKPATPVYATAANATSQVDNGLFAGTIYYYWVEAFNGAGASSAVTGSRATQIPLPVAPTNLAFPGVTANSITLSWVDNSDNESGFKVYRDTVNAKPATPVYTTAANAVSQADNGLSAGTIYYYWVEAYNATGSSGPVAGSQATDVSLPAAPTGLTFTGVTSGSITIGWTDNSDNESGFKVYRNTLNSKPAAPAYTTASNVTTQVDNGLAPGTIYFYWVEACNVAGSSSDITGSQATSVTVPAAPTAIIFANVTSGGITIGWTDNATNEAGFKVYRSLVNTKPATPAYTAAVNAATQVDNGLSPGTTYYYWVEAYNAAGSSSAITGSQATLQVIPLAPTGLVFTNITSSGITVGWADNSNNETGFNVYRNTTNSKPASPVHVTPSNATSQADAGLSAATVYYYWVEAFNGAGASSDISGNQTTVETAPSAPASLTFTGVTSSSITVGWTDNSTNESGFKVYRNTVNSKPGSPVYTTAANALSQTDTGLSAGTAYYYWVEAFNTAGSSGAIAGSQATGVTIPAVPSTMVFTGVTGSGMTVGWTDHSTNETGFSIYRNTVNIKPALPVYTASANAISQSDTGLQENTLYYYWVEAFNGAGASSALTGSRTTLPSLPFAPTALSFPGVTSSSITLSWSDNSDNETGFKVYRNTVNAKPATPVYTTAADAVSRIDNGLSAGTTYYYWVEAYNAAGSSGAITGSQATDVTAPASPIALTFTGVTSSAITVGWTDNSANESGFKVYRNTVSTKPATPAYTTAANAVSQVDAGLSASTIYYYWVEAYNAAGSSNAISGSQATGATLPAAPTSLTFTAVTSGAITIGWTDNSTDEAGFRIYRNTVNVKPATPVYNTAANAASQTDSGLSAGSTYFYWVEAYNSAGSSGAITGSQATANTVPAVPGALSFSGVTSTGLTVRWGDNSGNETGFYVYRNTVNTQPATPAYTVAANMASRVDAGLLPNTTYYYWVEAFNGIGTSSAISNSVSTLDTLPAAPANLVFSEVTSSSITLSWTDNATNETGFMIYRNTKNRKPASPLFTTADNATSWINNSSISWSTTYYYWVEAYNASGSSNAISGNATTPLMAPSGLTFTSVTSRSMVVGWTDNSSNETGFKIYRVKSDSVTNQPAVPVYTTARNVISLIDSGLLPNAPYGYWIESFNGAGPSAALYGEQATLNAPPAAPTSLAFSDVGPLTITLNWKDNSNNETGFNIYRSTVNLKPMAPFFTVAANETLRTDTGLSPNTLYYYWLEAFNTMGSSNSVSDSQTTLPAAGLEGKRQKEIPSSLGCSTNYPNPFNPVTTLQIGIPYSAQNSKSTLSLNVYDMSGRRVAILYQGGLEPGYHLFTWNGRDRRGNPAAAGLYLIRMTAGKFKKDIIAALIK